MHQQRNSIPMPIDDDKTDRYIRCPSDPEREFMQRLESLLIDQKAQLTMLADSFKDASTCAVSSKDAALYNLCRQMAQQAADKMSIAILSFNQPLNRHE